MGLNKLQHYSANDIFIGALEIGNNVEIITFYEFHTLHIITQTHHFTASKSRVAAACLCVCVCVYVQSTGIYYILPCEIG